LGSASRIVAVSMGQLEVDRSSNFGHAISILDSWGPGAVGISYTSTDTMCVEISGNIFRMNAKWRDQQSCRSDFSVWSGWFSYSDLDGRQVDRKNRQSNSGYESGFFGFT